MINYPVRCVIIDVEGSEVLPGILGRTPDESKPHIGEHGLAEDLDAGVKITLDGGRGILWGYECWWVTEKDWEETHRSEKAVSENQKRI